MPSPEVPSREVENVAPIDVPLYDLELSPLEFQAVVAPLERGWITMGPYTERFERAFAERLGVEHVVAVGSGTAALHLGLRALDIGPGDEVICPSLTFVATANAVRYVGAEVVFCDILGEDDLTLDPDDVESRITPRTRAVIAVDYAGYPADLPRLARLCARRGIHLIEDAAHACVSTLHGRACGAWGRCGAFSFFTNKNITCGEGGAVATDDANVAERVRLLRSHGMTSGTVERHRGQALDYDVVDLGYNYRLDEMRSSMLLAQLDRLDDFLARRQEAVARYRDLLADVPVTLPDFGWPARRGTGDRVGHHIFPVLLPEGVDRIGVRRHMREVGVQTSVHYPPIHRTSSFADGSTDEALPRTEALAARELTLPLFPGLTRPQQVRVRESLLEALDNSGGS